jgi:hypothetical protein
MAVLLAVVTYLFFAMVRRYPPLAPVLFKLHTMRARGAWGEVLIATRELLPRSAPGLDQARLLVFLGICAEVERDWKEALELFDFAAAEFVRAGSDPATLGERQALRARRALTLLMLQREGEALRALEELAADELDPRARALAVRVDAVRLWRGEAYVELRRLLASESDALHLLGPEDRALLQDMRIEAQLAAEEHRCTR